MKTRLFYLVSLVLVAVLLLCSGAHPAFAQEGQLPTTPEPTEPDRWPPGRRSPESAQAHSPSQMQAQATGGPDDFGYTWDDSVAFSWIDASAATDTGLASNCSSMASVPIGFSFKYYENAYSAIYVDFNGYMMLGSTSSCYWHGQTKSPGSPNNVIAPYWGHFNSAANHVRYMQGGSAPNRYLVVEWYQMTDAHASGSNYTFEAILYENGDILFQYQTMNYSGGNGGAGTGIEDSTGLDGFSYQYYSQIANDKAVRFYRPAVAARIKIYPLYQGAFTCAGGMIVFQIPLRNTGELGSDTYDLVASSSWPISLYAADATTPLSDTDGDGIIDSGSVSQGGTANIIAKVQAPGSANVGDACAASVTARSSLNTGKSKTITLQTAIPAPFAQVYQDNYDGTMSLYLAQPGGQQAKKAANNLYGYDPAVAEAPNGDFAYVWQRGRCVGSNCNIYVYEIEYTLLNKYGDTVRGVRRLTDNSRATMSTYDVSPAVAVAPDGRIGILWYHYIYQYIDNKSQYNYNIFFAVLDGSGNIAYGPVNLTNNTAWGSPGSDPNVPAFNSPQIAATGDNRFVLAWQKQYRVSDCSSNDCYLEDVYYAVRDTAGGEVKGITQFTNDTTGSSWEAYYAPNLTALTGNRALIDWYRNSDGETYYAVLESGGNIIKAATSTNSRGVGSPADAAPLSDGRIILAWKGYPSHNPGEQPWTARYYNGDELTEPAVLTRTDDTINFSWGEGSPAPAVNVNFFSVRWTGTISVSAGTYRFTMGSDDGSRLYIDDQLVMNHWYECCTDWSKEVALSGGAHQVKMEMRELWGQAYAHLSWESDRTDIQFLVLDSAYNRASGPIRLSNPAAVTGDDYVSVTADNAGHAILTCMDSNWDNRRNLYYALVNGNGSILTQPMIFRTSQGPATLLETSYSGYGNTSYSSPIAAGVDTAIWPRSSLASGAPGGSASIGLNYASHGQTSATGVVVTATLGTGLTYLHDTSGVSPSISGNLVTWSLPGISFLDERQFTLNVSLPSTAAIGARYPVVLTLTANETDADTSDNTANLEVMAALQVYLPLVRR